MPFFGSGGNTSTGCNSHFCCAHSGRYDCKRHIENKQHKDFIKLKQSSRWLANYCVENQTKTNLDMQIVKAEAITCEIITDNNLSLSTANPLSRSFKVMFPDSKMFDASYDGLHLSTQNYTYPH